MSEWIRPAACESGSCVEYRTVGDKVFVRNGGTENLSDDGNMLVFTAAEWDTFVAGLVAPMRAEADSWRRVAERLQQELNEAQDVLNALADAGLLLPPGGETREEWGSPVQFGYLMPEKQRTTTSTHHRTVTVWPDADHPNDNWSRYVGPWTEVPDDPS